MKTINKNVFKLLYMSIKSTFLIEVFFRSFTILIMYPFTVQCVNYALSHTKYSYLTMENLIDFLRQPLTVGILIVLLILWSLFFYMHITSHLSFFWSYLCGDKLNMTHIFQIDKQYMHQIFQTKRFHVIFFAPFFMMITNIPYIALMLTKVRIPNYFLRSIYQMGILKFIIFLIIVILLVGCYLLLFAVSSSNIGGKGFFDAMKESLNMFKGSHRTVLFSFVFWNVIFLFVSAVIYILLVSIAAAGVLAFSGKAYVIARFLLVHDYVLTITGFIISSLSLVGNCALITILSDRLQLKMYSDNRKRWHMNYNFKSTGNEVQTKNRFFRLLLFVAIIGGYAVFTRSYGSAFGKIELFHDTYITSHRGSSNAPENTMRAVELAVEEMADYVEIDVRETKDGEVVLMHDASLKRTTGLNKKVWDITFLELSLLDAGAYSNKVKEHMPIPKLKDVIEYCKGKVFLNIELKTKDFSGSLEDKVIALIEEYDIMDQCVITSSNYRVITYLKEACPQVKTGYILHAVYGNFYKNADVDFFSIKSSFVDERMVMEVHKYGKEIHVWTVNKRRELERLVNLGVDNIITDQPVLAREVVQQEQPNKTFFELLKRVIRFV